MRSLRELKEEATTSAKRHGHKMLPFVGREPGKAMSICRVCGKAIYVNTQPAPNGIDISGEAVATECKG